jgi:hypothetical protein
LLDEHISFVVAEQMAVHRPEIPIVSLRDWQRGVFLEADDDVLLAHAHALGETLVTYDQQTIPPLIRAWAAQGRSHGGLVFVDDRSIPSYDFGGLIRALAGLWDQQAFIDWKDRIWYLQPAPRP